MKRERRQTFRDILAEVGKANAQQLMNRAWIANRIAKTAQTGRARVFAYRVKTDALVMLDKRFAEAVTVSPDSRCGSRFVLVKVRHSNFGLHAPASRFGRRAA